VAEKSVWSHLKGKFTFGIIERHEDSLVLGQADTSYNFRHSPMVVQHGDGIKWVEKGRNYSGWIELKQGVVPKRDSSIVQIKFEPEQKPWLKWRGLYGADAWVLVRADRTYLLFYWTDIDELGKVPMGKLKELAANYWIGGINSIELRETLMRFN